MMTDAEIAELRAENAERRKRKEAATPGPWRDDKGYRVYGSEDDELSLFEGKHLAGTASDMAFCAAARNDPVEDRIDALLAEIERLKPFEGALEAFKEKNWHLLK